MTPRRTTVGPVAQRVVRRLPELRRKRHLSQGGMAQRMGVARPYISKVESGRCEPYPEAVLRFAEALRVPIAVLVEDELTAWLMEAIPKMTPEQKALLLGYADGLSRAAAAAGAEAAA